MLYLHIIYEYEDAPVVTRTTPPAAARFQPDIHLKPTVSPPEPDVRFLDICCCPQDGQIGPLCGNPPPLTSELDERKQRRTAKAILI